MAMESDAEINAGQPLQEVEGFSRIITAPSGPTHSLGLRDRAGANPGIDFRGYAKGWWTLSWWRRALPDTPALEWETHPVPQRAATVITFVGSSYNSPFNVYPANKARLLIDGRPAITFDLGVRTAMLWQSDGIRLEFAPRRIQLASDGYERQDEMHGNSGIYRLTVPADMVTPGAPLRLRIDPEPAREGTVSFFMIKDRQNTMEVSTRTNAEEITQLQDDVSQLRRVIGALSHKLYPQLFRERVPSNETVLYQPGRDQCNDLDLAMADDGALMLAFRQAAEHVAPHGRTVLLRSRNGTETWGEPQTVVQFPWPADIRGHTFHRMGGGSWLMSILVFNNVDEGGERREPDPGRGDYETWFLRSGDDGQTWTLDDEPLDPGPLTDVTVFSPAVRLPDSRLLMPVSSCLSAPPSAALFVSDDDGRLWRPYSSIGDVPDGYVTRFPETTLARGESGMLVAIIRVSNGNYLKSFSEDDGSSWTDWEETPIPCYGTRGRLTTLSGGEMLLSYAWRSRRKEGLDDLGAIKLALSHDEGRTWASEDIRILRDDFLNWDMGYPVTAELGDGRLFTVYWGNQMDRYYIAGNLFEKWWQG